MNDVAESQQHKKFVMNLVWLTYSTICTHRNIRGSRRIDFALGPLTSVADWKKIDSTPTIYYESFFHQYKGDHCAMVIDVPSKILFGNSTISLFDPAGR